MDIRMDIRMPFDSELYPHLIHASHAHTALMPRMSARNQQPHASNSHTPLTVTWYTRCSKPAAVASSPTLVQSLQNKHFATQSILSERRVLQSRVVKTSGLGVFPTRLVCARCMMPRRFVSAPPRLPKYPFSNTHSQMFQ